MIVKNLLPREFDRAGAPCGFPTDRGGARHIPQPFGGDIKTVGVSFRKRLAPRLRESGAQRVHARCPILRLLCRA